MAKKYRTSIITPNIPKANYRILQNGVKAFHIVAAPVVHDLVGGVKVNAYGYNGSVPGPTIIVNQGDYVQITVENRLPEATSVHWHGLIVSNRMDGVPGPGGSPIIQPGESFTYQFYIHQSGTFMYHSHVHNAEQELMGLVGMFISRGVLDETVDKDYVLLLQEWALKMNEMSSKMDASMKKDMSMAARVDGRQQMKHEEEGLAPGVYELDTTSMMYNYFTINGKAYPDTEPLRVKYGEKIRIRLGNLSMDSHPMHFHGHDFVVTAGDGNQLSPYARVKKNTINVAPGETWDIEFIANNPGNWVFHCHKPHHTTNMHTSGLGGMLTIVRYEYPQSYNR